MLLAFLFMVLFNVLVVPAGFGLLLSLGDIVLRCLLPILHPLLDLLDHLLLLSQLGRFAFVVPSF